MLTPFILSVLGTINKYSLLSKGDHVLVGLSGGPDSVCLLRTLDALKPSLALALSAVYVDHGMRPSETGGEIVFCRELCNRLGVSFEVERIDVKNYAKEQHMNVQEAAREMRYRIFGEQAGRRSAGKIALGHTADDQAETLLMRLLRGSGPTGLAGIPPRRDAIVRPLIEVPREEILAFLREEQAAFVNDSSNSRKDYFRNSVRLDLLPQLKKMNPEVVSTLSKTAEILRDEERYFDILVTKSLMKMISRKKEDKVELFLSPLEALDKVILRRVLRRVIDATKGLKGIAFAHIEAIIDLIRSGKSGDRIYLPHGIRIIRDYSTLVMTSEPPSVLSGGVLNVPGETYLKEAGMLIRADIEERSEELREEPGRDVVLLDADKLLFPLSLRAREKGDFFYPEGFGKRKKIQDFFVDEKVPRDERDRIPLLISSGEIASVLGYRNDERYRVNPETKKVLRLELRKARD